MATVGAFRSSPRGTRGFAYGAHLARRLGVRGGCPWLDRGWVGAAGRALRRAGRGRITLWPACRPGERAVVIRVNGRPNPGSRFKGSIRGNSKTALGADAAAAAAVSRCKALRPGSSKAASGRGVGSGSRFMGSVPGKCKSRTRRGRRCRGGGLTVQGIASGQFKSCIWPGRWLRLTVHGISTGKCKSRTWRGRRCRGGGLTVHGIASGQFDSRIWTGRWLQLTVHGIVRKMQKPQVPARGSSHGAWHSWEFEAAFWTGLAHGSWDRRKMQRHSAGRAVTVQGIGPQFNSRLDGAWLRLTVHGISTGDLKGIGPGRHCRGGGSRCKALRPSRSKAASGPVWPPRPCGVCDAVALPPCGAGAWARPEGQRPCGMALRVKRAQAGSARPGQPLVRILGPRPGITLGLPRGLPLGGGPSRPALLKRLPGRATAASGVAAGAGRR